MNLKQNLVDKGKQVEDIVISNYEYKEIMKIILKHYYGYKYEEISEIIGCSLGTVRSRLHNAVKYIIKEIERKEII